jgi:hypothetical protein
MQNGVPWLIAAAITLLVVGAGAGIRLAVIADAAQRARAREAAAAVAQYGLLFGFAAVAAAISAHGLVGFARNNMGLPGWWPYLLWGALDGAAGLCAVLLMRRAARGESALAPRLAVWGLVTASSLFNWAHAPDHPGAREAFALMPVIAATLFEFSLRETRHTARGAERRLTGVEWLRPVERIRVRLQLSADEKVSAEAATRRVRADCAARRLYVLRQVLAARERAGRASAIATHRVRRAERRAQAALTRAWFTDAAIAADVLRQVQVLTLTQTLAGLDYATPDHAQQVLASLIAPGSASAQAPGAPISSASRARQPSSVIGNVTFNGYPAARSLNGTSVEPAAPAVSDGLVGLAAPGTGHPAPAAASPTARSQSRSRGSAGHDGPVIDVAARIVADARLRGGRLSQAGLARQLRAEGYSIANDRLRWLAAVSGLAPDEDRA